MIHDALLILWDCTQANGKIDEVRWYKICLQIHTEMLNLPNSLTISEKCYFLCQ